MMRRMVFFAYMVASVTAAAFGIGKHIGSHGLVDLHMQMIGSCAGTTEPQACLADIKTYDAMMAWCSSEMGIRDREDCRDEMTEAYLGGVR